MRLLNIKINPEVLNKLTNPQLDCIKRQMDISLKKANQNVLEDEFVGDFYDRYDIFQKIYEARKRAH
jgi:hypothetical protein